MPSFLHRELTETLDMAQSTMRLQCGTRLASAESNSSALVRRPLLPRTLPLWFDESESQAAKGWGNLTLTLTLL